jgi:chitodextrinase
VTSRRLMLCAATVLLLARGAEPAPPVPAEFQDLYSELYSYITDFRQTIDQSWDGTRSPVAFSANLLAANSSGGTDLLAPGAIDQVRQELDGLKGLGVKAVSLDISFPVLYAPFHTTNGGDYAEFLAFYVQVAQDVRARGLTLIVETQAVFTQGPYTNWDLEAYYDSLTVEEYGQGRMEVARTIALTLQPDYLSVIQEPDTEAAQTRKFVVGTVEGSTALLNTILDGLRSAGIGDVAIGAGIGTWQTDYLSYVGRFASTSIDFVDMHIFTINRDYLFRALEIADLARSFGKQVGISQTWPYKVRNSELDAAWFPTLFSRDVFSFWSPLDAAYLQALTELAHFKQLAFVSPFWTGYFRAYLTYDETTSSLPPSELMVLARDEQASKIRAGTYTPTGHSYKNNILVPPDAEPPAAPPDLTAEVLFPNVVLRWSPAADNVGTAAYRIYRDRVFIGQTALTSFLDADLAEAQRYTYLVVALDASRNRSPVAAVVVTTPDRTAPAAPTDLAVAMRVGDSQVDLDLTWTAPTDNVGVTNYRIYRGTDAANLAAFATSDTASYTITNAPPETTWYFAVSAVDAAKNNSEQTPPVSVTVPAIPDTTPPNVDIGYPTEDLVVSRTTYLYASVYDLRGGLYDVPSGPAGVQFQIDGVNIGPDLVIPYTVDNQYSVYRLQVDTTDFRNGPHAVAAVGRDVAGNRATSEEVTVIVQND